MIINTLKALIVAGRDALQTTCGLPVTGEHISQIRQGNLTFPALAELEISGGALQKVPLGGDSMLCGHLAEHVATAHGQSGIGALADHFIKQLVEEIEGRYPRGRVVNLDIEPITLQTRGIGSFGFRLETPIGQLYLMAEVPSKMELEMAKGSEYLIGMIETYLPSKWLAIDELTRSSQIDSFLVMLRKIEANVQVDIPAGDGTCYVHTGFLAEQCNFENKRALKLSMDLVEASCGSFEVGDRVNTRVGIQDRSIDFEMEFLAWQDHQIIGSAKLPCMIFSIPDHLMINQRRRSFRISVHSEIPVEIEAQHDVIQHSDSGGEGLAPPRIKGRLADLSFSGARIVGNWQELSSHLSEGDRVRCRVFFPEEPGPLELLGVIRRKTSYLATRNEWRDALGIEFIVTPDMDRMALDYIRQYVLSEQRAWLSRRVHTTNTTSW